MRGKRPGDWNIAMHWVVYQIEVIKKLFQHINLKSWTLSQKKYT